MREEGAVYGGLVLDLSLTFCLVGDSSTEEPVVGGRSVRETCCGFGCSSELPRRQEPNTQVKESTPSFMPKISESCIRRSSRSISASGRRQDPI